MIKGPIQSSKEKILSAATRCFFDKGFDGTSISSIAKKAQITQSLIFHYFESKEKLWKEVTVTYLTNFLPQASIKITDRTTLKDFIEYYITSQFSLYTNHPDFLRFLGWQRLSLMETTQEEKGYSLPLNSLLKNIEELQKRNKIRLDLNPQAVALMIDGIIMTPFYSHSSIFFDPSFLKNDFLKAAIYCVISGLEPKSLT